MLDACAFLGRPTKKKLRDENSVLEIACKARFDGVVVPAIWVRELMRISLPEHLGRDGKALWRQAKALLSLERLQQALSVQSWFSPWLRVESPAEMAASREAAAVALANARAVDSSYRERQKNDDDILAAAQRVAASLGERCVAVLVTEDRQLLRRAQDADGVVGLTCNDLARFAKRRAEMRAGDGTREEPAAAPDTAVPNAAADASPSVDAAIAGDGPEEPPAKKQRRTATTKTVTAVKIVRKAASVRAAAEPETLEDRRTAEEIQRLDEDRLERAELLAYVVGRRATKSAKEALALEQAVLASPEYAVLRSVTGPWRAYYTWLLKARRGDAESGS